MMLCQRKPDWPTVLAVLGVGWLIATFLTGAGMYMVMCHAPRQDQIITIGSIKVRQEFIEDGRRDDGLCWRGSWTLQDGQVMLILGCLLNGLLLALMLANMFLDRRRPLPPQIQERPPDYETLIKEETPPPSYFELNLSSFSSSSCAPASASSCSHLVNPQHPPPYSFPPTSV